MSEIKEFKTETKKLLDLMINSIYTNREIFLRELISNASDAIDKYHYLSLNDDKLEKRNDYAIHLEVNKKKRTITISDNGIGMTKDELVNNLGTIAKSGSSEFAKKLNGDEASSVDIIGQFGVGFYSAFMVAKNVQVDTKSPFSDQAYRFSSTGEGKYKIEDIKKEETGTSIKITLRDNKDEDNYDEFLDEYRLQELVKKYSDYIRYPIRMNVTHYDPKIDKDGNEIEGETVENVVEETLNSMIPIWKKNKNEVTTEQLNEFYKSKFNDYEDPLLASYTNVEGVVSYSSLLFIPAKAPQNLYSDKFEKGLQLYTKGVFIMDKCKDLLPDYLRFVKGLVDSSDLSLNISREILQQDRQLVKIAKNIEKKIVSELEKLINDDFDKYLKFFEVYGLNIKYGIYENYGMNKDLLKDLVIYQTLNNEKKITLKQYVENMKENQEFIYFASGKTKASVLTLPQMDMIKKQGYDVLILTDDVDEFAIMMLDKYQEKKFKSITQGDLDILSTEEKSKIDELKESKKTLLEKMKEYLKDEVNDVCLSKRLVDSPVCIVSGENGLSLEMEKVLTSMPGNNNDVKATKILEINPNHELFIAIEKVYEQEPEQLSNYANLLYNQALLIEGMPLKNPSEFSKLMCELMIKAVK